MNDFLSLFRGRKDVFAVRWEKASKSGYMPSISMTYITIARIK